MKRNKFFQRLTYNWVAKVICFLLAVVVFYAVGYLGQSERVLALPVEVILPSDYKATSIVPQSADLVLRGREDMIYLIPPSAIKLTADFSVVSSEGITSVPIQISLDESVELLDFDNITVTTKPSEFKVFFERGQ